jgi:alkylation response protein AidB-like acyl-CoA dehydrogenase
MDHTNLDDETLRLLHEALQRYGRERYGFEQRRQRMNQPGGWGRDAWADYAAMGWLAMPAPAQAGGFASQPQAIGALMQYAGQCLALEPLFASVVLCGRLLGLAAEDALAQASLQELASGQSVFALAHAEHDSAGMNGPVTTRVQAGRLTGNKRLVLHGDCANRLLVSARDNEGRLGLYLTDGQGAGIDRSAFVLLDGRGAAHVSLSGAPCQAIAPSHDAQTLLSQSLDDARLALCAEGYGAAKALNAMTLNYLKERKQFGRPIGSNQALQHRMVELYMLEQEGRAVIGAAYRAPNGQRRAAIHAALAHVMTLGRQAAHEAVQLHGGIGITEELAVSHYFRRLMVVNRLLGDRSEQVERFAALQWPVAAPPTL